MYTLAVEKKIHDNIVDLTLWLPGSLVQKQIHWIRWWKATGDEEKTTFKGLDKELWHCV